MYSARKNASPRILPSTQGVRLVPPQPVLATAGRARQRASLAPSHLSTLQAWVIGLLSLLREAADGVHVRLRHADGAERALRCDYLVGADGARSTVRDIWPCPMTARRTHASGVVIECDRDPLDAPYRRACSEPRRPYVCLRLPYGLRRWEFMLFPGGDGEQMLQPSAGADPAGPAHVATPRLNVIRARVYRTTRAWRATSMQGAYCTLAVMPRTSRRPGSSKGPQRRAARRLQPGLETGLDLDTPAAAAGAARATDERHAHARAMIELADLFGSALSILPTRCWPGCATAACWR